MKNTLVMASSDGTIGGKPRPTNRVKTIEAQIQSPKASLLDLIRLTESLMKVENCRADNMGLIICIIDPILRFICL